MAIGIASAVLNGWLNALCRGANITAPAAFFVKLHTGDPGASGTSNAAGNTTRVAATFGSAASAGSISNTAAIDWTSVSTSDTLGHVGFWDGPSSGRFLGSDDLAVPRTVTAGDNFTIATAELTLAITPAAA